MCASKSARGHTITHIVFETKMPDRMLNQIEEKKLKRDFENEKKIGIQENSLLTLREHIQSIENQNENKPIKTESNIITQWNVKCKTA